MVQLKRPLDFQAVTDHAEYVGTVRLANDPTSALSKLPIADKLKVHSKDDIQKIYLFLGASLLKNEPIKELIDPEVAGNIWKQTVAIADKYYQPGKFTTFAAYEWTSTPNNSNMHRNVIFKDTKKVPDVPYTSIDSTHPEDLWSWMDAQRRAGNELLGDLAQRQSVRRHHVSVGCRQQRASDRRRLGAGPDEQRTAVGNHPAQGHVGDPSEPFAQRRIREFRDFHLSARAAPRARPGSTAAIFGRPTRMASGCRTPAATTRTSSGSWARATRTTPPSPTCNRTISAATGSSTPHRRLA